MCLIFYYLHIDQFAFCHHNKAIHTFFQVQIEPDTSPLQHFHQDFPSHFIDSTCGLHNVVNFHFPYRIQPLQMLTLIRAKQIFSKFKITIMHYNDYINTNTQTLIDKQVGMMRSTSKIIDSKIAIFVRGNNVPRSLCIEAHRSKNKIICSND